MSGVVTANDEDKDFPAPFVSVVLKTCILFSLNRVTRKIFLFSGS
jgi:hypothetical protein